jgi:glycerol-3-phosphate dehydrogenase
VHQRITRSFESLGEQFDLAIIGGGITGVCVAREAASRGLRTILVERNDFGSGTSAATTKYIHGGIRYLEQFDVAVVRESLRERRILALGAPHLVQQTRFIMPGWRWSKPPTALIGAGVLAYHGLSYDRNIDAPDSLRIPRPRWMSKSELLRAVPWLDPSELQGGFAYHDTLNIHPERLLLDYALSASAAGATLLNHVEALGFLVAEADGSLSVTGLRVRDRLSGSEHAIAARVVVNAAGPWIDRALEPLGRSLGVGVDRSKGVHVLTRPLGDGRVEDAVFARARSGRHVIVSPWMGKSFIGPTDTPLAADDDPVVDPDDVESILATVNSTMSDQERPLTVDDVELTTVGVRPLIRRTDEPSATYSASRRHELYHHADSGVTNLWSIGGGKWTTARATAEQMVDSLLDNELHDARTHAFASRRTAAYGAFAWAEDPQPFLDQATREMEAVGVDHDSAMLVARLFGASYPRILELIEAQPSLAEPVSEAGDIGAQVVVAVADESARTLSDIVDRRLVAGTVRAPSADTLTHIARIAGDLLGWSPDRCLDEVRRELDRRHVLESHWRKSSTSKN